MNLLRSIGLRRSTCVLVYSLLASSSQVGVESRFVSVGDLRLQYTDWGGVGEPLIFIPGGCDTAFVFGDVAPRLATHFRVVGLTARGCGASDRPASGYGIENQIGDIVGLMDALTLHRPPLFAPPSASGKITNLPH